MSRKLFSFRFECEESLSVKEIWPDGDAPENPTAEDVKKAFLESCRGNVRRGLEDWGFLDGLTEYDVDIIELRPAKKWRDLWRSSYQEHVLPNERWENEGGR